MIQTFEHDFSDEEGINYQKVVLYSDHQAEIAEKDKRIAELNEIAEGYRLTAELLNEALNKKIAELEATNTVYREAFEDWLNFSVDVYTSDFPGMEWLINLQKKTSELIAQDAIGKEAK